MAEAVDVAAADEVVEVDDVASQRGGMRTMFSSGEIRIAHASRWIVSLLVIGLFTAPATGQGPSQAPPAKPAADQTTYASPDEAVSALRAAVTTGDKTALGKMFGPASSEFASGDDVADKASYALFAKRLARMTNLVKRGDSTVVLHLGAENWPFQFPITRSGDRWFFDGEAGLEELFNRRIGSNELHTVKVCRELVRAQREYADEDRDGDEVREYAQRFLSRSGAMDGLYWPTDDGTDESPLGPLVAYANGENYNAASASQAFHGYLFRILPRQGASAPGGSYGYVINGNMIGGFAIVAYPATWGSSGLTTFIVNHQGKVYQKDLGPRTAALAAGMRAYAPDKTWTLVDED